MFIRAFAVLALLFTAACGGGGGSGSSGGAAPAPGPGSFSAAGAPGYGSNSTPRRIATGGTPNIDAAPADLAFPFLLSSLGYSDTGSGPVQWVSDAGASFTFESSSHGGDAVLSMGSNTHVLALVSGSPAGGYALYGASDTGNDYSVSAGFLDHTAFGVWAIDTKSNPSGMAGGFITGYETFSAAMPINGVAVYTGDVRGIAVSADGIYALSGDASMSVNFGTGAVGGNLTNMTASGPGGAAWNNVSFSAGLSGSGFSGTTVTHGGGTGPATIANGATGTIGGQFFGPGAEEAGAVWTLSDGTVSATGSFGAAR